MKGRNKRIRALKKAMMPAQTSAEIRAQLFRRNSPTPVKIPNTPTAMKKSSVTMATDLAGAGRFSRPEVLEIRAVPIRPKAEMKIARALPRIATTPATITEAEGFDEDMMENYIAFPGGGGQANRGKKAAARKAIDQVVSWKDETALAC